MVKRRKLKINLNIRFNESIMCANLSDPKSQDRELRHKNTSIFSMKIYLFAYNLKTT